MVAEVKMLSLQECASAFPELRFAVDAADSDTFTATSASRAEEAHDLAGIGKLLLGLTLAHLGEGDEGFLEHPLAVTAEHRAGARTGTLRLMSGDLELRVDDAVNLVFSTGDAACVLALLEFTKSEGVDLLAEAQNLVDTLGLNAFQFTGTEEAKSWGEGLLGRTTCAGTLELLRALGTPSDLETAGTAATELAEPPALSLKTRQRMHGWMGRVFEPAGLASALPGFGPNRVAHQTLSGLELTTRGSECGYSSVLTLPTEAGEWVHVAAHMPPSSAGFQSPRDVSAALGTLGLSAYHSA
ncbi:serine hydrolase [Nesterenkonia halotolerans]|uniref:serine hydrolase n=1 Tax=Nesterenkonia halotolerans TaxID=225325 RepID=UPI003EE6F94F